MSLLDFETQPSIYYTDDHKEYRQVVRNYCEDYLFKYWDGSEKVNKIPQNFYKDTAQKYKGVYSFPFGYGEWINPKTQSKVKWDPFYSIIFSQETRGAQGGLGAWIHYIALPCIIYFGKNKIHKDVIEQVINGDKLISLAVSELNGGSDVANMKTTAEKTQDGEHYIINGSKYWITGGHRADYFVTLVRTGDSKSGRNGLSLILVPRQEGVITSKLKMQGADLNDTASVTFVNVKVSVKNIIGEVNKGFIPLMLNFNFERFYVACDMISTCKLCIDDVILWGKERSTFNELLINHQVIKHKIAEMSRLTLASHSLLEKCAYQLKQDKLGRADESCPRNIALLKVQSSRTLQYVTIECSQIFGGRSYIVGSRARFAETAYRGVRAGAISAGSEEIMLDLAIKQAKL